MFRLLPPTRRHACRRHGPPCPRCQRPPLGVWQRRVEVLLALLEDRAGLGAFAIQRELRWLRSEVEALAASLRQAGFTEPTVRPLEELASDLAPVEGDPLGCWEVTRLWERADLGLRAFGSGSPEPPPRRARRDFWRG